MGLKVTYLCNNNNKCSKVLAAKYGIKSVYVYIPCFFFIPVLAAKYGIKSVFTPPVASLYK